MNILDEIKESFKKGSTLTKLIYVNLGVFIVIKLIKVFFFLSGTPEAFDQIIVWLSVPAEIKELFRSPWSIFSYMFLHEGLIHLLFNVIVLYWFGKIFLQYLDGKKLLSVYLLGGLSGAFLFVFSYNVFTVLPLESILLGASGSVTAVLIAIALYAPNFTIHLMFIGPVKLKWLVPITIVSNIIFLGDGNAGGLFAHLGGALYGYLYISQMRKGKNISKGFDKFMDSVFSFFKPRQKIKVTHRKSVTDIEYNTQKVVKQKEIDKILDKIAKSGYESLSKKEKEILFRMGNKNK